MKTKCTNLMIFTFFPWNLVTQNFHNLFLFFLISCFGKFLLIKKAFKEHCHGTTLKLFKNKHE